MMPYNAVIALAFLAPTGGLEAEIESSIQAWSKELSTFGEGVPLKQVDDFLKGKYRDKGTIRIPGTGGFFVYYLVDDFVQVRLWCDSNDKLVVVPLAERKGPWLRGPDGRLRKFPENHDKEKDKK